MTKTEPLGGPLSGTASAQTTEAGQAAVGRAHSKLILIGEHAVVHGQPAIALPFPLVGVEAALAPAAGPFAIECALYSGSAAAAPEALHGLTACLSETMKRLGIAAEGLLLRLTSTIPPGRGLGSSAAVAIAAVRSVFAGLGREAPSHELIALANIAEVHAHGTPSGIDAQTVAADQPLWFVKGQPSEPLPAGTAFELVVADSGRFGDTRSAVAAVRERLAAKSAETLARLHRLGELARQARHALAAGDAAGLGRVLDRAHAELADLGISDAGLNRLVRAARRAGALGAKLTGGGRGGCIVALARDARHARHICGELARAGARRLWRHTFGGDSGTAALSAEQDDCAVTARGSHPDTAVTVAEKEER